ncbi:patatin-like phospholipase family protein [Bacteroidota bacterium]
MKKIGLALGAGGARGLAHIVCLEAFEELGIKPSIISGTSIGAMVGAPYASGISAQQMRDAVKELVFSKNTKFWEIHKKSDIMKMFNFFDPDYKVGGMIKGEKMIKFIHDHMKIDKFEDLQVPLKIVTTNYWNKEEIVFEKGDLLKAIKASYSLPGMFIPVEINGQLLMDGGLVNPLPYDLIEDECDITVAIDVSANKTVMEDSVPPARIFFPLL